VSDSPKVAVVKRLWALFNQLDPDPDVRRAAPETDELLNLFDPEIEWVQPAILPDAGVSRGREELRDTWDDWFEVFAQHHSEIVEIVERGDRVLVLTRNRLVGRDGITAEFDGGSILTFSERGIRRGENVADLDAARRQFEEGG
jgi:ketosteroid isomerase-like protein